MEFLQVKKGNRKHTCLRCRIMFIASRINYFDAAVNESFEVIENNLFFPDGGGRISAA